VVPPSNPWGSPVRKDDYTNGRGGHCYLPELSLKQSDLIYQQVGKEMKESDNATIDDFVERAKRYRLCLQLKTVQFGTKSLVEIPNDTEVASLPGLLDLVIEEALTTITITNSRPEEPGWIQPYGFQIGGLCGT
jgi:hypothetical protein